MYPFFLILLVVGTAGCTFQDFNSFDSNTTKNYTGYGVTFNYPGNWMVISENSTGIRTTPKISGSWWGCTR